jgi:glucose-6-phosphate dehydrogenase assembly protein OpcA
MEELASSGGEHTLGPVKRQGTTGCGVTKNRRTDAIYGTLKIEEAAAANMYNQRRRAHGRSSTLRLTEIMCH